MPMADLKKKYKILKADIGESIQDLHNITQAFRMSYKLDIIGKHGFFGFAPINKIHGCTDIHNFFINLSKSRALIEAALRKNNIADAHFYPLTLHRQTMFNFLFGDVTLLTKSQHFAEKVISLPTSPEP